MAPNSSELLTIPIPQLGINYFACGVPGHCANGMKAMIEVRATCSTWDVSWQILTIKKGLVTALRFSYDIDIVPEMCVLELKFLL